MGWPVTSAVPCRHGTECPDCIAEMNAGSRGGREPSVGARLLGPTKERVSRCCSSGRGWAAALNRCASERESTRAGTEFGGRRVHTTRPTLSQVIR